MVVGAKMTIQHVPSKGRISIMKIQNFTVLKRQSVVKIIYGIMLMIVAIVMVAIKPIDIATNWYLEIKEGAFLYKMWEKPTYELFTEVWIYNYTNVPEYLSGDETKLKLEEVGPFLFQELRTNENITLDRELGIMTMNPKLQLDFLVNKSLGDPKDIPLFMPNVALIALSTLAADKLGYFANSGAYLSMKTLGSPLFRSMTANEILWGYHDPLVTVANTFLPGWIDFSKIGILDRFYAPKQDKVEVELGDLSRKFSINKWNDLPGITEQGYKDLNHSSPCNVIKGAYEGLMISPGSTRNTSIRMFRRQACRIYPLRFKEQRIHDAGIEFYRYSLENSAFNRTSAFACECVDNICLPDGFVDVKNCYYGFPIALSKPHFLHADPTQKSYFEGMNPDEEKHGTILDIEPILGIPLSLKSQIQVNIAVRTNPGNPITNPVKDKVLPILWLSLYCKHPSEDVISLLRLRFVIAPPMVVTVEVILFLIGFLLGVQGAYRMLRPTYKLIPKEDSPKTRNVERKKSLVSENVAFRDDDDLAKQAVSLLAITEEDDVPELIIT